jgi:hypothetical protein
MALVLGGPRRVPRPSIGWGNVAPEPEMLTSA